MNIRRWEVAAVFGVLFVGSLAIDWPSTKRSARDWFRKWVLRYQGRRMIQVWEYYDGKKNHVFEACQWYINQSFDESSEVLLQAFGEHVQKQIVSDHNSTIRHEHVPINFIFRSGDYADTASGRLPAQKLCLSCDARHQETLGDFLDVCMEKYRLFCKQETNNPKVYRYHDGEWKGKTDLNHRSMAHLVLPEKQRELLERECNQFQHNPSFYAKLNINRSLGFFFHGPPGTGKTSTICALANFFGRDVYYLTLNNIKSDNDLLNVFDKVDIRRCVFVLEDIDCADIVSRRDQNVTISTFLNVLDGVFNRNGRILVMTSNNKQDIDDALLRPGRIDVALEFGHCTIDMLRQFFQLFFDDCFWWCDQKGSSHHCQNCALCTELEEKLKKNPITPATFCMVVRQHHHEGPKKVMENLLKLIT